MSLLVFLSVPFAFMILTAAVIYNFIAEDKSEKVSRYKKSGVDTASMYAVVGLMYLSFRISYLTPFTFLRFNPNYGLQVGAALLVLFCLGVNLLGRLALNKQWSNMIKIKEGHKVIEKGPFRFVRHPLYTSIMGIILGAGLIYGNYGVLVLLVLAFYPMMVYRAKQEEVMLESLEGYNAYKERTGQFFPKFKR